MRSFLFFNININSYKFVSDFSGKRHAVWLVGSCFADQGLNSTLRELSPNHWTTSKFPAVTSLPLNYTLDAADTFQYALNILKEIKEERKRERKILRTLAAECWTGITQS